MIIRVQRGGLMAHMAFPLNTTLFINHKFGYDMDEVLAISTATSLKQYPS